MARCPRPHLSLSAPPHQSEPVPNAEDTARLSIAQASMATLADFQRRSTSKYNAAMSARYDNPCSELDRDAEQAKEQMLTGLRVLSSEAPLSTLARYGYHDPKDAPIGSDNGHGEGGTNGSTDSQTYYEPATAPRSTDRPRPEYMVNAAVSVDRGVVIRAGSGAGSLVSGDDSTRTLEHVSANKKALPPA